jgi:uncharacterized protein YgbK (DUF1537 family)
MTGSPLRSFCIVADDLSGAADCAAAFASPAVPVPVFLGDGGEDEARLAIDTDSRGMGEAEAISATARVFQRIAGRSPVHDLVYKKIDSTLRGHVGAEIAAALRAAPRFAGALVAPSFPEQGRSLVGGKLLVQGRPADQLGHAGDLLSMLAEAGLRPMLLGRPQDAAQLVRAIGDALASGARAVAVDAADGGDLAHLARAVHSPGMSRLLVAGSAGLARALAPLVNEGTAGADPSDGKGSPASMAAGPVVAVVGSFSKASAAQVETIEASGDAQVFRLSADEWLAERHAAIRQKALDRAGERLDGGGNVLFAVGGEVVQPFSRSLVQAMSRATAPLLQKAAACVLTGGDTARAMFNQLDVKRLEVTGEFEPGISTARGAPASAVFVLKAGGFGDAMALQRIVREFGRRSRPDHCAPAGA